MNEILQAIKKLIEHGEVRISEHGYDELAEDGIYVRDIIETIHDALVIEEYPGYHKGPAVLVKQRDDDNQPIHIVWGIPKGKPSPAVLVTAYRPDPQRWDDYYLKRKK